MDWFYLKGILILSGINLMAVLGLSLLTGFTGLFSFGHAGFMAIGAYAAAFLGVNLGLPLIVSLLTGGLVAGIISLFIGRLTLRPVSYTHLDVYKRQVWGQCELNTVKMLAEELNNAGGLLGATIEVIGYDTRGDAMEAVNCVRRLTGQDKVVCILGPNASGQAIPISSILEEMKVPDIATVATNPKVTVVDGKTKPFN